MTAYSITVTQSVRVFGGQPSDQWNASYAVWNAFAWGYGTADVPQNVRHLLSESLASTGTVLGHTVFHLISDSAATWSDGVAYRYERVFSDSMGITAAVADLWVQDPNGWFRVFHPGTINGVSQSDSSWSASASAVVSWTSTAGASTVWS